MLFPSSSLLFLKILMPPKFNWAQIGAINRNNRNNNPNMNPVAQNNQQQPQQQPQPQNIPVVHHPFNQHQLAAFRRREYAPLGQWRIGNGRPASAVAWMFSIRLSPDPNDPHFFSMRQQLDDNGQVANNYRPLPLAQLNNPMQQRGVAALPAVPVYLVYQLEQGDNGNPLFGDGYHYQGYVEFSARVTAPQIIDIMQWQGFWWDVWLEPRRNTREHCVNYVTKEETRVMWDNPNDNLGPRAVITVEEGQPRGDDVVDQAAMIRQMIADGANYDDIAAAYPERAMRCVNGIKALIVERIKSLPKVWREVTCFVHWGDTRTGKSKRVYDIEGYDKVYQKIAKSAYYDGYDLEKHEVLIIDDFTPGDMEVAEFLKICDGQPLLVNQKYGCSVARWKRVYITSNVPPSQWFPKATKKQMEAVFHRLMTGGVTQFIDKNNKEAVSDYHLDVQFKMGDPRDRQNVFFSGQTFEQSLDDSLSE